MLYAMILVFGLLCFFFGRFSYKEKAELFYQLSLKMEEQIDILCAKLLILSDENEKLKKELKELSKNV